jgi:hypothetical protein
MATAVIGVISNGRGEAMVWRMRLRLLAINAEAIVIVLTLITTFPYSSFAKHVNMRRIYRTMTINSDLPARAFQTRSPEKHQP